LRTRHTTAERGGSSYSTTNFISWVADCMGVENSTSDNSSNNKDSSRINIKIVYLILLYLLGY